MIGAVANGGVFDVIYDGEVPRAFTGRARMTISGGQFVTVSGAANVVGSTADLFMTGSILLTLPTTDTQGVIGFATNNAGSNELVGVAQRGTYIVNSADSISGGYSVYLLSGTIQAFAAAVGVAGSTQPIGRAVTGAGSGTISPFLISLNI